MKILLLSDAQSIHTKRWVSALAERGLNIVLYSIKLPTDSFYTEIEKRFSLKSYYFDLFKYKREKGGKIAALKYHREAVKELKRIISIEKPDILHAHYLTSYSLIAALSGFKPLIVSVWGSDIYEFPKKSFINRLSVKFILRRADRVLSTSNVMAAECAKYTGKKIDITPFGVDTELFAPKKREKEDKREVTIGTVKSLSHKYGIDLLIRSFALFCQQNPEIEAKLKIAGEGPDLDKLKEIAFKCGVEGRVSFLGFVPNGNVAELLNSFDFALFLSREESFGVAAVEAMACGKCVITSSAPGFTEVVEDGKSGFIINGNGSEEEIIKLSSRAIERLVREPDLAVKMGIEGRKRVEKLYDWRKNVSTMINIYEEIWKI